jgi:CheY-like chemotaxis protein
MAKVRENTPLRRDLDEVLDASHRAADLTRQLLLFSRRHMTHLVPLQMNRAVDELLKMLHRLIGEDIVIRTGLTPDLWSIQADRGSVEQIIVNLSINARDAMPNGGFLTLKTENVVLDDFYCKLVPEARPGQFVRISIADTGSGMSAEIRERIFEPFFSTKGPGKGTGLGLSVVYGIVKQHNGWINIYSEVGQGTEFKIYFPAVFVTPEENPAPLKNLKTLDGMGERILVVEDEKCVREFSVSALEKHGYRVTAVSTVADAVKVFVRERGAFDLVFTDVVLPDATGMSMADHLRRRSPSVKVLFTSGYTGTKSQWRQIKAKGLHFLQKPYTLVDLLQSVKRELTKS